MENTLDKALGETFPASDPVAYTPRRPGKTGTTSSVTGPDQDAKAVSERARPAAARPPNVRRGWAR